MAKKLTFVFAVYALVAGSAMAQETPVIDQREANQEKRIEQGVNSGSINDKEAQRLERGQQRVDHLEDKAKADGKVTRKERKRIRRAENHNSRQIRRAKHNRR